MNMGTELAVLTPHNSTLLQRLKQSVELSIRRQNSLQASLHAPLSTRGFHGPSQIDNSQRIFDHLQLQRLFARQHHDSSFDQGHPQREAPHIRT
jgi:hypothetical protein